MKTSARLRSYNKEVKHIKTIAANKLNEQMLDSHTEMKCKCTNNDPNCLEGEQQCSSSAINDGATKPLDNALILPTLIDIIRPKRL